MTIGCNIWMICLKLNWFFYGRSRMLQFSQFVWPLSYSVWDVFNNFLLIDREVRLVAIKSALYCIKPIPPCIFSWILPLMLTPFTSSPWLNLLKKLMTLQNMKMCRTCQESKQNWQVVCVLVQRASVDLC